MRRKLAAGVVAAVLTALLAACDGDGATAGDGSGGSGNPLVGVILPDETTAQRWKTQDPVYFKEAFGAARIAADIRNARGGLPREYEEIAASMIDEGARVLVLSSLDDRSGRAVIARAHAKKIPVIDYDRLTVNGGADYHVGFDYEEIGRMQAYGLAKCLDQKKVRKPIVAEINGSPADHSASRLRAGHDTVMQPMYDNGSYVKGPSQSVPNWNPETARGVFTQMMDQQPGINGVLAANDAFADSAIAILRVLGKAGAVPVTGQDATLPALRNMLTGDQCMTVYKRLRPEAQTAAHIATQLFNGRKPVVGGQIRDPESGAPVPFAGLVPLPVTVGEIKDVVADGYVSADQLCTGTYKQLCRKYRVAT